LGPFLIWRKKRWTVGLNPTASSTQCRCQQATGRKGLGRASERPIETAAQGAASENQAMGRSWSWAERFSLLFFLQITVLIDFLLRF
jgi:hypothetical protein